jgi:hypothetical protein
MTERQHSPERTEPRATTGPPVLVDGRNVLGAAAMRKAVSVFDASARQIG